jgi:EAL domain-containing protein (putative c-di-GMP-specific phosphodiesterase class I)
MKKAKAVTSSESSRKMRPALSPEARENQLVSLAVDLAEKQLRDGTASSQVITHYLKLGSTKEKIEKEILEKQKELIDAKTQSLQSAQRIEELYKNALDAMRNYSGQGDPDDY